MSRAHDAPTLGTCTKTARAVLAQVKNHRRGAPSAAPPSEVVRPAQYPKGSVVETMFGDGLVEGHRFDSVVTLDQKHESVEVYTVRLLAWPLRRRGNHPVAYFQPAQLRKTARTVALLKQKNSSLSTDSSTSTASGNKTSGKAVLVANHAVHWSSKLYKAGTLYRHANLLRSYQMDGLNWILRCYYQRRSCILADEMGLGKTVQVVTTLEHLYSREELPGPFLVSVETLRV